MFSIGNLNVTPVNVNNASSVDIFYYARLASFHRSTYQREEMPNEIVGDSIIKSLGFPFPPLVQVVS